MSWLHGHSVRKADAFVMYVVAPGRSNGYLVVRRSGGLNHQPNAICEAVLAARIMNATLVLLPNLDNNSIWHHESGFPDIYDVDHFVTSLKHDVRVVRSLPTMWFKEKQKMTMKPFQLRPPRDATVDWYETTALEKMLEHGAIYLTPFSHHLTKELGNSHEYQRLCCRVNYHALRFTNEVRNLSSIIVERLRLKGPYISIHLGFELKMLASKGCWDNSKAVEQEVLKYQNENFADKELEHAHMRQIGQCPMSPKEVGLFLHSLGFDNSTLIYLADGENFSNKIFLDPLRALFPHLETQYSVATPEEWALLSTRGGLLGPAVDYLVCLLSEIFVPTYDGPSNFSSNLIGHRLYSGFRRTLQPDQKALAPLFIALEDGLLEQTDFEASVREVMSGKSSGIPHRRIAPESFSTNPWPECFCSKSAKHNVHRCPSKAFSFWSYVLDQDDNYSYWNV